MREGAEPTSRWEWLATVALLAIPWVIVCVACWPGHLNAPDSLYQHQVWIHLLLAGLGAVVFLRRAYSEPPLVVGALAKAMITFQLGIFAVGIVSQYRFEYVAVVGGAVLGALLATEAAFSYRAGLREAIGNRGAHPAGPSPAPASPSAAAYSGRATVSGR